MSSNPNRQKIGKRRNAPGQQQPEWLFPATGNPALAPKKPIDEERVDSKKEKRVAKDLLKRPTDGGFPSSPPPAQLLELVRAFLVEQSFTKTVRSFKTEHGEPTGNLEGVPSLSTIYKEWCESKYEKESSGTNFNREGTKIPKSSRMEKIEKQKIRAEKITSDIDISSTSSEDSDVDMMDAQPGKKASARKSSSSSTSSSSSDSDADDEKEAPVVKIASPKPKSIVNSLKRKAASSNSSSTSSSDSSSDEEAPKIKKVKTANLSPSNSSSSSSGSGSDSSSESEAPESKKFKTGSSSDSGSSSSSDDDSESSENSVARKIPLPESNSDSTSTSDSDSSDKDDGKKAKVSSDTSATLSDGPKKMTPTSSEPSSDSSSSLSGSEMEQKTPSATAHRKISPPLPPTPGAKLARKVNVPFSRIPKDIKVDERLASNAYVPYDYAQKAHEDLIVTRGKGFTKEKNKKKRGSYRGGYIDVEGKKGIKFDD